MGRQVAVIGAGIVGVSTALTLVRDGHSVTLIDRLGPAEGTSFGNGGVLASCSMVPVTVPGLLRKAPRMLFDPNQPLFVKWGYLPRLMPWLVKYLRHANAADMKRIAAAVAGVVTNALAEHQALARGTKAARWIVPSDYLFLYRDRAQYEGDALGWSVRREHGFRWDEMERAAVAAYDPVWSDRIGFAARMGDHGRIADPGQYVKDLAAEVAALGGRILKAEVEDLVREDGAVTGVRLKGGTIPCDAAVIATGVWSGPLAARLGLDVPLESERGYHVELWEPSVMPRSPVMVASGKFVATPMDGRLRLAGVVEFGGTEVPASTAPIDLLMRQIGAAIPGLTWKERTEWMGHRPAPADSIPVIGQVPGVKGAYLGFGHHHIGLTSGPRTGRILAGLIGGTPTNMDLTPYSARRFVRRA